MQQIEKQEKIVVLSITSLLNTFDKMFEEIEKLDKEILKLVVQDKEVQRLMTIPGIGPITALTYTTEIFDPARFKDSKSVGAYLGMTPKQYASGEVQR
jgi:transposase